MPRLLIGGILALVACTGGGPTSPARTPDGVRAPEAAASASPQRAGTRVVAPRTSAVGRVALGGWGGDHVELTVTDAGATLEYDCAHGTIDQPLLVDSSGRFDLVGTHIREHGGPIRIDEKRDKHPARYTGTTDGKTMTLTVTVTDSAAPPTTFTLARGRTGRVVKCV